MAIRMKANTAKQADGTFSLIQSERSSLLTRGRAPAAAKMREDASDRPVLHRLRVEAYAARLGRSTARARPEQGPAA